MKSARGVALITVLLVVALAATICAALVARQQLTIRTTANQLHARQAWHYARGGEQLAVGMLRADMRQGGDVDHLGEAWAMRQPAYPVQGGEVGVAIDDLSGRLNLNSLVVDGQLDAESFARLQRLLALLRVDPQLAWQLVAWMAPALVAEGVRNQAERAYLARLPPHRSADRALHDVSELRLLAGMDEASYQRVLPHVVALPVGADLNLNTAGPWVLASLADGMTLADGQRLVAARGEAGFASVDAFLAQPALQRLRVGRGNLSVRSHWFSASSEALIGQRRLRLVSTLQRQGSVVRAVNRQLAPTFSAENR